jgi:starch phosphorylase
MSHIFKPEYEDNSISSGKMSNTTVPRERRPSTGAPIDLQGPVGPGFTRPKHKRTFTGFGAGEIKSVEGMSILPILSIVQFVLF